MYEFAGMILFLLAGGALLYTFKIISNPPKEVK